MHTLVLIIVCMYGCMIDCMDTNTDTDTNNAVFIHSSPLRAARAQTKGTDRMTSECWSMVPEKKVSIKDMDKRKGDDRREEGRTVILI